MKDVRELTDLPAKGRFYLVPCVYGNWCGTEDYWPVIGPQHNDKEHLGFSDQHFHVDGRFIPSPVYARAGYETAAWPLVVKDVAAPILRRRKCRYELLVFPYDRADRNGGHTALWSAYAGRKCPSDAQGLLCPHRGTPLGSLPVDRGAIVCPLHGLRIHAASGVVLTRGEVP